MDNGLHALETVPKGHFMAFGGEVVKKSCEVCGYFYHHQEYSHHELGCNLGDGNHPMQFLPSWVESKNGEDLMRSANSYLGLLRQSDHSHNDRAKLARIALCKGHCVDGDFTKVYRRRNSLER